MPDSTERYYGNPMRVRQPWWGGYIKRFVKNLSRIEVAANLNLSGKACLDIACGEGTLINKHLSRRYEKLIGIDISRSLILRAGRNRRENCNFINTDLEGFVARQKHLKNKYSDVYMLAILEHINWPLETIKKIKSILAPHGRIIVEVPNVGWLPYRISMLFGNFPLTAPTFGAIAGVHDEHIRFFTVQSMDEMFKKLGFKRMVIKSSGRFTVIKKILPSLLSSDIVAVYEK